MEPQGFQKGNVQTLQHEAGYFKYQKPKFQPSEVQKLEIHSRNSHEESIVHFVETLFEDRYLYGHPHFRQLVQSQQKGYVEISKIIRQPFLIQSLKSLEGFQDIQNEVQKQTREFEQFLKQKVMHIVKEHSGKLVCNKTMIRRRTPFTNCLANVKPLYFENYPEDDGNEEFEGLLESVSQIYKIIYDHEVNFSIVFAENPEKLKTLDGYEMSNRLRLRVQSYEETMEIFSMGLTETLEMNLEVLYRSSRPRYRKPKQHRHKHRFPRIERHGPNTDHDDGRIVDEYEEQFKEQEQKMKEELLERQKFYEPCSELNYSHLKTLSQSFLFKKGGISVKWPKDDDIIDRFLQERVLGRSFEDLGMSMSKQTDSEMNYDFQ